MMESIIKIEDNIISIITEINPYADFDMSTHLFKEGVIDSLTILFLVSMLEEKFSIKIHESEFKPEHFSSVQNIADFIIRLRGD